MPAAFIFESLKLYLKARNFTYKQLAEGLGTSEQTIKRMFISTDCSLERMLEICNFLQIDLSSLIKGAPTRSVLIEALTWKQEEEFASNHKLLLIAICVMNMWRFDEMAANLTLSKAEITALLMRLKKMNFIEVHPNHHYRLLVARHFSWIPDGPIMRLIKGLSGDYFDHSFVEQGELLRIINVRASVKVRDLMRSRLDQVAQEIADLVSSESHLPLVDRPPLSICIASRVWVPEFMSGLFRVSKAP
jgi:transcriptional regulator with XRE-family HTH domain